MQNISAELSLYPLRQPRLSPVIDEALRILRAHGLAFELRSMSTFVSGDDKTIFEAFQEVWLRAAARGDVVMHLTLSNACPGDGASLSKPTTG
jgi:uncharacterized protein YqgV (UPF0045/DUF77 family)